MVHLTMNVYVGYVCVVQMLIHSIQNMVRIDNAPSLWFWIQAIKQSIDQLFGSDWNVVCGTFFAYDVSTSRGDVLAFYLDLTQTETIAILIWRICRWTYKYTNLLKNSITPVHTHTTWSPELQEPPILCFLKYRVVKKKQPTSSVKPLYHYHHH